jgi:predicted site-specific integrase-resolvase
LFLFVFIINLFKEIIFSNKILFSLFLMNEEFLAPREVVRMLHIHRDTLFKWTHQGKIPSIKTASGQNRYPKSAVLTLASSQVKDTAPKLNFCYARVSSRGQKNDLQRQIELLSSQFPHHTLITDIGSGINFKRKGFQTLLDQTLQGNIGEIVITHKDRLCRFGFDLFESILHKCSHGKIVVLHRRDTSPTEELTTDLITIITVFTSRLYGFRSHQVKKKINTLLEEEKREGGTNPEGKTVSHQNGGTTTQDDDGTVSLVL